MCVYRNIEVRSCNRCYSGIAVSVTYCECVFVALGAQHAMGTRHIVIYSLPGCAIFLQIILQEAQFSKK